MYIYIYIQIYITHAYTHRERDTHTCIYIYVHMQIYTYIHTHTLLRGIVQYHFIGLIHSKKPREILVVVVVDPHNLAGLSHHLEHGRGRSSTPDVGINHQPNGRLDIARGSIQEPVHNNPAELAKGQQHVRQRGLVDVKGAVEGINDRDRAHRVQELVCVDEGHPLAVRAVLTDSMGEGAQLGLVDDGAVGVQRGVESVSELDDARGDVGLEHYV
jgi:hypothetical protein